MNTFHKILFVLAILIANCISASAIEFTVDGVRYSVNDGNKTVTVAGYPSDSKPTGDLTIPESVTYGGISYPVTSIGEEAFSDCSGLASVTIGNSVSSIGRWAFRGCIRLASVTIPNSVTEIGGWAFYGTAWYNNQPNGLVYAGLVAYKYKGKMPSGTSIVLKEGTKGITGNAFYDCDGLTSVTIRNSVTSIGDWAFGNCTGLTRIDAYPNPEKVGTGVDAFDGVPKDGTLHVLPKYLCAYLTASQWRDFTNIKDDLTEIGDINLDGKVDVTDVTTLVNMILNGETANIELADINADGKVNVSDVTALVNIILK